MGRFEAQIQWFNNRGTIDSLIVHISVVAVVQDEGMVSIIHKCFYTLIWKVHQMCTQNNVIGHYQNRESINTCLPHLFIDPCLTWHWGIQSSHSGSVCTMYWCKSVRKWSDRSSCCISPSPLLLACQHLLGLNLLYRGYRTVMDLVLLGAWLKERKVIHKLAFEINRKKTYTHKNRYEYFNRNHAPVNLDIPIVPFNSDLITMLSCSSSCLMSPCSIFLLLPLFQKTLFLQ